MDMFSRGVLLIKFKNPPDMFKNGMTSTTPMTQLMAHKRIALLNKSNTYGGVESAVMIPLHVFSDEEIAVRFV